MSETFVSPTDESASEIDFDLEARLDALECGECTEDDLVAEILVLRNSAPDFVWTTLALIDQRYRRGHLSEPLFRSIKSKIARNELQERDYGTTPEAHSALRASRATERIGEFGVPAPESSPASDHADSSNLDRTGPAVIAETAVTESSIVEVRATHSAVRAPEVGSVLENRYVLEALLGHGGMGTVFKALDRCRADLAPGNRHVAVKILDEHVSEQAEILADLRREFYCAQALSHPSIVKVYEMHQDNDVAFFTMELLEGELLSSVLERTQPARLPRTYAWAIIRSVGAGVAHAHSRNVVHGDLKPRNIMITERGEVRILDFGASSRATRKMATSDPLERNHSLAATPAYTCCELLDGQQTDPRDDLYALACLSYELLSGEHPFQHRRSTEARDLGMQPRRPPELTDSQWQTLQLGLSWYRENRSLSVRDWLTKLDLEPMAERLPPLQSPETVRLTRWTWTPGTRNAALLAGLLAAIGLWAALGHRPFNFNVAEVHGALNPKPAGAKGTAQPPVGHMSAANAKISSPRPAPAGSGMQTPRPELPVASIASEQKPAAESGTARPVIADARPPQADKITLVADTYTLHPDERFAEINVRRMGASNRNSSFVWWTEPSSARPGSDFVAQNRTTHVFAKGRRSARLFIRIVPNPSRTRMETFFVVIGAPSDGYSLGAVTRAAVQIPPLS
jgi:serine/threonine protein kinase